MIKLYLYRLGGFLDKAALSSRAEKSRLISKTAYKLLADRLTEINIEPKICKTDRGKPYIENSSYHISISHSDDAVLLAVSNEQIGVDIEKSREFSPHAEKRLFSEKEKTYLSLDDRNYRATVLWTLREAVCKATGEGFADWFFNCEFVDDDCNILSVYNGYNLKVIEIDGYICTVATVSAVDDIEFFDSTL